MSLKRMLDCVCISVDTGVFVTAGVCVCNCDCVIFDLLSVMLVWLHFVQNKLKNKLVNNENLN